MVSTSEVGDRLRVEEAKRVIEEDEKRKKEDISSHRKNDRALVRPFHFHATIFTAVEIDENGNFKDSMQHNVWGMSPDSCIRKALNRAEERQKRYHMSSLEECHDQTHPTREMDD